MTNPSPQGAATLAHRVERPKLQRSFAFAGGFFVLGNRYAPSRQGDEA